MMPTYRTRGPINESAAFLDSMKGANASKMDDAAGAYEAGLNANAKAASAHQRVSRLPRGLLEGNAPQSATSELRGGLDRAAPGSASSQPSRLSVEADRGLLGEPMLRPQSKPYSIGRPSNRSTRPTPAASPEAVAPSGPVVRDLLGDPPLNGQGSRRSAVGNQPDASLGAPAAKKPRTGKADRDQMAESIADAYQGGGDLNIEQLMMASNLSRANATVVYRTMRPVLESSAPLAEKISIIKNMIASKSGVFSLPGVLAGASVTDRDLLSPDEHGF